jgi:integral membrane protein (TIGR01906 family)
LTIGLVLAVGLLSLVGFDQLFLAFHLVSFSNDLWQLDPSRDYLIAMFPEGFFLDATLWIVASTVAEAALLAAVPMALMRWMPVRARRTTETPAAAG